MTRVPLPSQRELVVDRARGLVIVWIWDIKGDRCSSGPFAVREGELATLVDALTNVGARNEVS
jgi:hypothetical protein